MQTLKHLFFILLQKSRENKTNESSITILQKFRENTISSTFFILHQKFREIRYYYTTFSLKNYTLYQFDEIFQEGGHA